MEVKVVIRHDVAPELIDYLMIDTSGYIELGCPELTLYDFDMDELQDDIRKIARRAEYINRIYDQAGYPWIAAEVLDGHSIIMDGKLIYLQGHEPKTIREKIEKITGPLSDSQFCVVADMVTQDIKFNNLEFGTKTDINTVVKIAAICFEALQKCS